MSCHQAIEEVTRKTAETLYALTGSGVPHLFDAGRWSGRFMAQVMRDDSFKVSLFRFIDLLPALKDDDLVVRMLLEHFGRADACPLLLRRGLRRIAAGTSSPRAAARTARAALRTFAQRFIPCEALADAGSALGALRKAGLAVSVDILGEEVLSSREEDAYAEKYGELMRLVGPEAKAWTGHDLLDGDDRESLPRFDISLKVSSLYSQLDPVDFEGAAGRVMSAVGPLVTAAREHGASITFDMEHSYHKDLTISVFRSVMEKHRDFRFGGIALQTYLPETEDDIRKLIAWAKENRRRITIRLVKGAYWEYETIVNRQNCWPVPVFLDKAETDRNFEKLTSLLLENAEHVRPAIATHNVRSIAHAVAAADALKLQAEAFEFQMIHGMAEPVRSATAAMGYRVRTYSPIGKLQPGMAYLIRRLLENTAPVSALRKMYFDREPFDCLVQPPKPAKNTLPEESPGDAFRNEPTLDFSRPANRIMMREALADDGKNQGRRYPLVIGGQEVAATAEIVSRNPARPDEIVGSVAAADRSLADKATAAARDAWPLWRTTPPEERAGYLFRAAEVLRCRRYGLAAREVHEVGKTWKEADADVAEAVDFLEYYGREMVRLGQPLRPGDYAGEDNACEYLPKGVAVVISPWNFPLAIPAGMVSAALVTGNTVIFKPSGLAPITGRELVEAFGAAGLPPGVLQFLPGPGGEVGDHLVGHPGVDLVAFTGSREVGLRIVELAGTTHPGQRNVKRVIAEMGGKNAVIVDETADLDAAVKGVVESAFGFQGQKCSACSRVIIAGDIYDEFCDRLRDAAASLQIGPTDLPGNTLGPLVDEAAVERVRMYLALGENEARPLLPVQAERTGYFIGPALFADVNPASRIAQEEIFGPLVAIIRVSDFDEALAVANAVPYALTGGMYSRSPLHIARARREFLVGNLYINRKITGALVGRQPFGGFGMSGVGSKAGGPDYLLQFMNARSICENTLRKGFAPEKRL